MENEAVIDALSALAQETRLEAFRLLVQAGPTGLAAGQIGAALELPAATLSFHLKELRTAGLVHCEQRGRSRVYRCDFDRVRAVIEFMTENCCGSQLAACH